MNAPDEEQKMLTEIDRLATEVAAIWDQNDADGGVLLDSATIQKVKDNNKEIERLEGLVKQMRERAHERAQREREQKDLYERSIRRNRLPAPGSGSPPSDDQQGRKGRKSVGEQVVDDPTFAAWRSQMVIGGGVTGAKFGHSPRVPVPGGLKTLLTGAGATSAGALVDSEFLGLRDMGTFQRPLTIRDIITNGSTMSDVVDYVRITGFTNAAAPVAEATATGGSTGAKPESTLTFLTISEPVKTVAHWIPATRRSLADAGQLRTYIDGFLRYGLEEELEDQILTGDGVGENFTGILNVSGTQTQAWDTDLLTTLRRARTKVRLNGRAAPTAYVLHPNDWEDLDLLQDNEARYYFGGPSVLGSPRIWGLPVVESEGMTEGTGVVGDWRQAVLWDREMANVLMSDSHLDFFIRNMIAILAELRAAFGVLRPSAFVEADLTA